MSQRAKELLTHQQNRSFRVFVTYT